MAVSNPEPSKILPTLQHLASVRIASSLLQNYDLGKMLDKVIVTPPRSGPLSRVKSDKWKSIESQVVLKLPSLPPLLRTSVAKFIMPLHEEIISWLVNHNLFGVVTDLNYRSLLYWKTSGTIDAEKTAKNYAQNENIDVWDRFIMACNYFLTDDILYLWDKIRINGHRKLSSLHITYPVKFWVNLLKAGNTKPSNALFEKYVRDDRLNGMHMLISPYLRYLPPSSRQQYFSKFAPGNDNIQMCLDQIDAEEPDTGFGHFLF